MCHSYELAKRANPYMSRENERMRFLFSTSSLYSKEELIQLLFVRTSWFLETVQRSASDSEEYMEVKTTKYTIRNGYTNRMIY